MLVELKFTLPEDEDDMKLAVSAKSLWSVLWNFDQYLRSEIKHNDKEELQIVRDKLYELLDDNNVSLDMVS